MEEDEGLDFFAAFLSSSTSVVRDLRFIVFMRAGDRIVVEAGCVEIAIVCLQHWWDGRGRSGVDEKGRESALCLVSNASEREPCLQQDLADVAESR